MMGSLLLLLLVVIPVVATESRQLAYVHTPLSIKKRPGQTLSKEKRSPPLLSTADTKGKNDHLPESEKERLLRSEPALNAFIVAEMRDFATKAKIDADAYPSRRWKMNDKDKIALGIINEDKDVVDDAYDRDMDGDVAVDLICNVTETAFRDGYNEQGLLSALGSAICYFRDYYRTPRLVSACERIGMSDYAVAHHITDMYHHISFRGAYTKTLTPSGMGEIAAQLAVGLSVPSKDVKDGVGADDNDETEEIDERENDECLMWSPTTPGVCLHWKSDEEAWRKKRFERVQMEGTRDPRRGGSGTTR